METLSTDEIAFVFGYLSWKEILHARVCKTFKHAASLTLVPPTDSVPHVLGKCEFCVESTRSYRALATWMANALPNLQQICFFNLPNINNGEDPEYGQDDHRIGSHLPAHQIDIISAYKNLTSLTLGNISLNGCYPGLFRFPLLKKLHIYDVERLKLNLEEISNCTLLEEIFFMALGHLSGDVKSLRFAKNTLQIIHIQSCSGMSGNFMDLGDFPKLEWLCLDDTSVSGDWRKLKGHHFPALNQISLPIGVYGSCMRAFDHVEDAPEVMNVICALIKRNGTVIDEGRQWHLADESVDHYDMDIFSLLGPPFQIEVVHAGPRLGWRWTNGKRRGCCEVVWYDDEPIESSTENVVYVRELERLKAEIGSYRGFSRPPTEEEYCRLSTHW